jgi:protein-disulfide isomerase
MQRRRLIFAFALALATALSNACGPAQEKPATAPVPAGSSSAPIVAADASPPPQALGVADFGPIPVFPDDPQTGSKTARVTIVEFSDLQCPFCARADATMARLAEAYDADSVRIVWKHYPLDFHQHARPLAEAAEGVFEMGGSGAFFNFVHTAFANQKDEDAPDIVSRWGARAGVDGHALEEGVRTKRWAARIDRDMQLAQQLGVQGTPAFYVNGVTVQGAQPFDKFRAIIDEELAKADALKKSGVPADRIYATATTENRKDAKTPRDEEAEAAAEEAKIVHRVPIGKSPVKGPATAAVTIVEFSDFQCNFCQRAEETVAALQKKYGDKVRVVWKDSPLPFHSRAEPAAELARAVRDQKGDAAFWDAHDRLFASQPALEDADLERVAKDAGVDAKKAMAAVKSKKYAAQIDEDLDLVDDLDADRTPHFFVNGHRVVGAAPIDSFTQIIDAEIAKVDEMVKAGTAPASVYDAIIANGVTPPDLERRHAAHNPAAPFRGAANAHVVIQEFADVQCPYCQRAEETMDQILKDYGTKVKIEWRNMPLSFHKDAQLAAEAGLEVKTQKGQPAFFKMLKTMFEHQKEEGGLERPALEGYAKALGCDMKKFGAALDGHTHKNEIDRDVNDAQNAGINGTPGFIINGYYVSGAQPYRKFKKVIERALHDPPPAPAGTFGKQDLTTGTGRDVKKGDTVRVHYTGTLTDGKVFDTSRTRNTPFEFTVGRGNVIRGWEEGLIGMKVGGKRKLTLPPDFAYGPNGHPPVIPPDATLIFEIELLEIK